MADEGMLGGEDLRSEGLRSKEEGLLSKEFTKGLL